MDLEVDADLLGAGGYRELPNPRLQALLTLQVVADPDGVSS